MELGSRWRTKLEITEVTGVAASEALIDGDSKGPKGSRQPPGARLELHNDPIWICYGGPWTLAFLPQDAYKNACSCHCTHSMIILQYPPAWKPLTRSLGGLGCRVPGGTQ